jgi:hypothetical protein
MNLQVIASSDGDILWVSGALPGSVHDKKPSGSEASCTNWSGGYGTAISGLCA